jgi:hypothetical protein
MILLWLMELRRHRRDVYIICIVPGYSQLHGLRFMCTNIPEVMQLLLALVLRNPSSRANLLRMLETNVDPPSSVQIKEIFATLLKENSKILLEGHVM